MSGEQVQPASLTDLFEFVLSSLVPVRNPRRTHHSCDFHLSVGERPIGSLHLILRSDTCGGICQRLSQVLGLFRALRVGYSLVLYKGKEQLSISFSPLRGQRRCVKNLIQKRCRPKGMKRFCSWRKMRSGENWRYQLCNGIAITFWKRSPPWKP